MIRVNLHGQLALVTGYDYLDLEVSTVAEIVRALMANFRGKIDQLFLTGSFKIVCQRQSGKEEEVTEQLLHMKLGRTAQTVDIIPVMEGSGGGHGKGVFSIIAGVILIAAVMIFAPELAAVAGPMADGATLDTVVAAPGLMGGLGATAFTLPVLGSVSYGSIAALGAAFLFQGMSNLISPSQNTPGPTNSYVFNGAVNATQQGGALPVLYGRMLVGSVLISGGIMVVDWPPGTNEPGSASDYGDTPGGPLHPVTNL